jgi:DNA-binding XRE family transcriptional regulator
MAVKKEKPVTGKQLFQIRKKLGLTQQQLGEHWGVDRNTIINYERLDTKPLPKNRMMKLLVEKLQEDHDKQQAEQALSES